MKIITELPYAIENPVPYFERYIFNGEMKMTLIFRDVPLFPTVIMRDAQVIKPSEKKEFHFWKSYRTIIRKMNQSTGIYYLIPVYHESRYDTPEPMLDAITFIRAVYHTAEKYIVDNDMVSVKDHGGRPIIWEDPNQISQFDWNEGYYEHESQVR